MAFGCPGPPHPRAQQRQANDSVLSDFRIFQSRQSRGTDKSSSLSGGCVVGFCCVIVRVIKGNRGSYMTKQLEGERIVRVSQQIGKEAPPAAPPKKLPSVKMKIASVQYSGAIATPKGDIPSWRITFLLDAEHLLATSLTVQATGANDVLEARESGLNILRRFAQELLDAAIVFHA